MKRDLDHETVFSTGESHYRLMESMQTSPHNRRCIDGKITGTGKCVGYCRFNGHPGYLTRKLREKHNCLEKGCNYFSPKEKEAIFFDTMARSLALI